MKEKSTKEIITELKIMLADSVNQLGDAIKKNEYGEIGYWTARIRGIEKNISNQAQLPLDEAIKGREKEYEEEIELHKTYGGS